MRLSTLILPLISATTPWNQRRPGFLEYLYDFWARGGEDLALIIVPVSAAILWWHFAGRYRRAERRRHQIESPSTKCFSCGYDLRSTLHRCPECGMPVTVRPTQAHVSLTPPRKGPHVERDVYLRTDGTFWAVELAGGQPVRALGPLPENQINQDPELLDFAEAEDATQWSMTGLVRTRELGRRKLIHEIAGRDRPRNA